MADGERLFEFDVSLCEYALGNIRQRLLAVAKRPKPSTGLRPHELDRLDFPHWFGECLRNNNHLIVSKPTRCPSLKQRI